MFAIIKSVAAEKFLCVSILAGISLLAVASGHVFIAAALASTAIIVSW